jgi:hypothetical protein
MGADLCGYILIGPMKLNKTKVKTAVKYAEETIALAKKASTNERSMFPSNERLDSVSVVRKRLPRIDPDSTDLDVLEECEEIADFDAKTAVKDFEEMWNKESYRDMMSRRLPGDNKKKIVACGERTWGDGPEEDSAWGVTDAVSRLGLLERLGIE